MLWFWNNGLLETQFLSFPQPTFEVRNSPDLSPQSHLPHDHHVGIEGTVSEGVRGFGLRRRRYVGLAKAHLQHVITAAAMNLSRLAAWLAGVPHGRTRVSRFARLALTG